MTRVALSNLNGGACKSIARLNQFRNENKLSWRNSETLVLKKSDLYNWIDKSLNMVGKSCLEIGRAGRQGNVGGAGRMDLLFLSVFV